MNIRVLGPVAAVDGHEPLGLGGVKQRTVLAVVVAAGGRPVSADVLIEAVWGGDAPSGARRTIQTYVSNLRSVLGDVIVRSGEGWALNLDPARVDAVVFERLVESAGEVGGADPEVAGRLYREALELWRGHAYVDVEAHGYLEPEVTRLSEMRLAGIEARVDADLALGRHSEVIGELEALLAEHPYREQFRAQLMVALYRAGRQREALGSYAALRELLVEELGVDPSPELQRLELQILEQDPALAVAPPSRISRRAVVVVDVEPVELARLGGAARGDVLGRVDALVRSVVEDAGGEVVGPAGTALFAVFDDAVAAVDTAGAIAAEADGVPVGVAVDFGDVEGSGELVSGPPVSRAARLVAAAHPGQVVVSAAAHRAVTADGDGSGLRFESLGPQRVAGVDDVVAVFQLLVGDPPRSFPPLVTDRVPPPLPAGYRSVPGYELREPIGHGSVGTMYRAYQPSMGREVAVEVIAKAESSDAEFIRRFEADVQRLSLLEHPHILPVLDYWRDTDGAFIVYPLLRGGGLQGALGEVDADRVIAQVGSALAYAHSCGLVHGSVAPDRVVLDEAGNIYLFGFPVAGISVLDPEAAAYHDTIDGEPTVASDVYSLAILAGTLRRGAEPDPDQPVDVSTGATTIEELLAELVPVSDRPETRYTEARNPYKGLAAFAESDAADFYGRRGVVEQLISVLAGGGFLAVVGPSGIGKSSVVRAGLIPALRRGAIAGSQRWVITDMTPGSHPFGELERALERVAVELPAELRERLSVADPDALAVIDAALPDDTELLLVVDQFEELFTMTDPDTAGGFLRLLTNTVAAGRARVVVTLRADFLDRPLGYSRFAELLDNRIVTVGSPTTEELTDAVTRPSANVGVTVEPAVTERIVAAVADQPGALPLLQHTLTELFTARSSDAIGLDDYEQVGGVTGSVAQRAETIYTGLDPDDQAATKQLFLQLVTIGDDATPTRRRVRIADLGYLDATTVIDAFTRNRLLVHDRDLTTHTPTVEVAHEALFTHWPRLASWIGDLQDDLIQRRRLNEAITEWDTNDHTDPYLLTGARLTQHQDWTSHTDLTLTDTETRYLAASTTYNQQQTRRRRRIRNATLTGFAAAALIATTLAIYALINANAARTRQLEAEAAALASAALAAMEADPELAVLLGIQSLDTATTDEGASALGQAIQSHRTRLELGPEGELFPGLGAVSPDGSLVVFAPLEPAPGGVLDGGPFLTVYRVADPGEPQWRYVADEGRGIRGATFNGDGRYVVAFEHPDLDAPDPGSSRLLLFDAGSGELVEAIEAPPCSVAEELGSGRHLDLSQPVIMSQAAPIAGGCDFFGSFRLVTFDLETGEVVEIADRWDYAFSTAGFPSMSGDGSRIAYSQGFGGAVIDIKTGQVLLALPPGDSTLNSDGTLVLTGSFGGNLELWDVDNGLKLREYPGDFNVTFFSPDETLIYAADADGGMVLFDTASGTELLRLRGPGNEAVNLSMTADQTLLASGSVPGTLRLWDIGSVMVGDAGLGDLESPMGDLDYPITESDRHLVIPWSTDAYSEPFRSTAYDRDTFQPLLDLEGQVFAISPDGTTAAIQRWGDTVTLSDEEAGVVGAPGGTYAVVGAIELVDLDTGTVVARMDGPCEWYNSPAWEVPGPGCGEFPDPWMDGALEMAFSPDGSLLAMGGWADIAVVWDTATGAVVWSESTEIGFPFGNAVVAFSPDGTYLATVHQLDGDIRIIDTSTWAEIARVPHDEFIRVLEFSGDGSLLVGGDNFSEVFVVDTDTWTAREPLSGQQGNFLADIDLSPDGRLVATAGFDGESWVWDIERRTVVRKWVSPGGRIMSVEFLDDETLLIVPEGGAAVAVTLDPEKQLTHARSTLTRSFSSDECATYGIDPCPTLEEIQSG